MSRNNEINIIYKINKEDKKEGKIKIFGDYFCNKNKNICKIIIDKKRYELISYYNIKKENKKELKIKLVDINDINDMSYMFYECSSLFNLPDISKRNTNNVTNMSYMFYKCSLLSNLPDI